MDAPVETGVLTVPPNRPLPFSLPLRDNAESGDVWSFGSNESGQLGIGQPSSSDHTHWEPRLVKELRGAKVVAVAAGNSHSMALTADGEVLSWGQSDWGALGHGGGE